jgi:hypothetical protein
LIIDKAYIFNAQKQTSNSNIIRPINYTVSSFQDHDIEEELWGENLKNFGLREAVLLYASGPYGPTESHKYVCYRDY